MRSRELSAAPNGRSSDDRRRVRVGPSFLPETIYEEFQTHYANLDWRTYMYAYLGREVKKAFGFLLRRQGPQRPLQPNSADDLAEHSPAQKKFDLGKLDRSYTHLRYFMQSYILINSGLQQQDSFGDQVHLWRTSRAVCAATPLWLIEAAIALFIFEKTLTFR